MLFVTFLTFIASNIPMLNVQFCLLLENLCDYCIVIALYSLFMCVIDSCLMVYFLKCSFILPVFGIVCDASYLIDFVSYYFVVFGSGITIVYAKTSRYHLIETSTTSLPLSLYPTLQNPLYFLSFLPTPPSPNKTQFSTTCFQTHLRSHTVFVFAKTIPMV